VHPVETPALFGFWYVLLPIGIAVSFLAWLLLGIDAVSKGMNPFVFLAAVPISVFLVLMAARAASHRAQSRRDQVESSDTVTPWRLCDPTFSHWGTWRADLGRLPPEIDGFTDRKRVDQFIRKLLSDWWWKSAPGGAVVAISKPVDPLCSPFSDGPKGWKVYRIRLEDERERRSTGWLRFGAGWVEFQVQPTDEERLGELLAASHPLDLPKPLDPAIADLRRSVGIAAFRTRAHVGPLD
jgi:hypothetical protein